MPPSQSTRSMSIRSQPESTRWWETTNCAGSFVRAASPRLLAFPGTTRLSAHGQRCRQAWRRGLMRDSAVVVKNALRAGSERAAPAGNSGQRQGDDSQVATDREILNVVSLDGQTLLECQLAATVHLHRPR